MRREESPEFDPARPLPSALSVLGAIFSRPKNFYLGFSAEGPLREPVLFVLLVSAVAAVLRTVVVLLSGFLFGAVGFGTVGVTVLEAVLYVLLSPLAVGVVAAVYLLSVRTFVGKVGNLREVYRMLAYAYGAMALAWIPVLGSFAFAYALMVLMALGIRSVYRTSTMTAVVTALVGFVPVAVAFIYLQVAVAGLTSP